MFHLRYHGTMSIRGHCHALCEDEKRHLDDAKLHQVSLFSKSLANLFFRDRLRKAVLFGGLIAVNSTGFECLLFSRLSTRYPQFLFPHSIFGDELFGPI